MDSLKNIFHLVPLSLFLILAACSQNTHRMQIDLSGYWNYKFEESSVYGDSLYLPGTTDLAEKGNLNTQTEETDNLSRIYTYEGKVWYRKTVVIPENWSGKEITLYMERTKPSRVYVDGRLAGSCTDISTSQVYNLTAQLTPGIHVLTIMVDNGKCLPARIVTKSHMYTDATQTNWNGIIGKFHLEARDVCHIGKVDVYPEYHEKKALVRVRISGSHEAKEEIRITCSGKSWNTDQERTVEEVAVRVSPGEEDCSFELDLGEDALTWSEFHPDLYKLEVRMRSGRFRDVEEVVFGLREFKTAGTQFVINDKVTFLRGKHEGCVFPLRGHTAMDVGTWRKHFRIAKEYGLNHYRFHSWCPPEACFEAADLEGFYLQPETPYWGTIRPTDTVLIDFMTKEGVNIRESYSNHASYVMFALGNELSGPQSVRKQIMDVIRQGENRHLHAYGSNNGSGYIPPQEDEDYYTTCRISGPYAGLERHTRASFAFCDAFDGGVMNHFYPGTERNFNHAVSLCSVPIISHESGQYQIYPNYDEMKKYTGVVEPRNFAVFRKRLEEAGMGGQAHDFLMASGKWAAELYMAEIEMDLRTAGFGGFQLLDLQDYPGQGSAFVGILDAFMDSKGLVTPEKWRESCCEVVPLFLCPVYTHFSDSSLQGKIQVANYSEKELRGKLNWMLKRPSGEICGKGSFNIRVPQGKLADIGTIDVALSEIGKSEKCSLELVVDGTPYKNTYPVWVYPSRIVTPPSSEILVTDQWNAEVLSRLQKGGKVLWFPSRESLGKVTVGGLFITDYWNFKMFEGASLRSKRPVSPGTLGLLMDPEHPLFQHFPTEFHSNWQWFPIVKESYPMILDSLPHSYLPIVQVIDNIERNHKLGLLYEFSVEGGKLLVCMSDLEAYKNCPEVRQFKNALFRYMESSSFKPEYHLTANALKRLFFFRVPPHVPAGSGQ